MTQTIADAAQQYRRRGWRVIQLHGITPDGACACRQGAQCGSAGKHPIDNGWQNTPPLSAADIQALWEERPNANLGLAVGEASGFWVLDIDPEHDGFTTMAALVAEHGPLPATFVVQTGSGGYHYYWAMPDVPLRNTQGRVGTGIDTRATGGQVVAAPSVSNKGPYRIYNDVPPAAAPAWLLEMVQRPEEPTTKVTSGELPKPEDIDPAEWERLNGYAGRAIEAERERLRQLAVLGWNGPGWNHTTFEVACSLLEFANSPWCAYGREQAEHDVFTLTPRDTQGFDDWVVKKTWASAIERVGDKARPVPVDKATEPDPLFAGPDVRRLDPTEPPPALPQFPGGGEPERFFGEGGIQIARLADEVMAERPLAWGRDNAFWSFADGVWVSDPEVVQRRCVDLLGNRYRNEHAKNAASVVKHRSIYLSGDPVERWINFENGMLDWRTGEMVGHDPNLKSTVQMAVPYDPVAACPNFEAFLHDVMHEDYVALAWEMLGYLMYSGNPLQVAFMFYGTGGNGKGTLMRVIEDLLGRDNVASESLDDLNGNRFSPVNLFGKIANLAGDIDGTYQESTASFKKLTGEDMIAGERKFGDRFKFESWAVPVFSANKIPGSADVSDGYLRRWIVLHFHKQIQNKIPGFSDILIRELPGIAYKATQALRVLMERGKFAPAGEALKGKEEFAQAIDQVRQWLASGDALQTPSAWTPVRDLYASYAIWAERSGQRKVREQEFSHRLEAIGHPVERQAGSMCHQGLTVPQQITTPANVWG